MQSHQSRTITDTEIQRSLEALSRMERGELKREPIDPELLKVLQDEGFLDEEKLTPLAGDFMPCWSRRYSH